MKKGLLVFLPFFLLVAGVFTSCEEVEEVGKYDNWRPRNEAFIDSLKTIVGTNAARVITGDEKYEDIISKLRVIPVGELFAIKDQLTSTNNTPVYIYCKKVSADNPDGERPLFTGAGSRVSAYYYGTNILGERFDGNFVGYSATDRGALPPAAKEPTEFDSPNSFSVLGVINGWTTVLQYMRTGERWMVYIPWISAYGASGSGSVLGYSTLTFDLIIEEVL